MKILNILTSLYHVERDTCTVHGRSIKTRYFGLILILRFKEGLTFYQTRSNAIILQGTLPAYCIPKVVRLKTGEVLYEKSYMSPRPVGKIVRQSCGEVQRATFSQLPQPKPKPICDRSGKPDSTENVFVVKGETSRSHEIDEKGFHGELGSSDTSGKPERLSENTRVKQTHDGSGQPDERSSSSAHTVKEQFAPEENRDIALFNTDNELNRAINEEDIDFNIPGVPHSTVKRSHGVNVQDLIQKIENHPHRHALQSDLQQREQLNPFSKESKDMIKAAGNIELCELLDVEPKAQCKICLSYWDVGIVYCTCGHFLRDDTTENKKYIKSVLDLFCIPNYYLKKGRPHGHRYGKKNARREISWVFTTGSSVMRSSARTLLTLAAMKKYVVRWTNWRTKTTRTTLQKKNSTYTVAIGGFVRILLVPTRCPQSIELISKKHCQPCDTSRTRRIQLITKSGKALPHPGGTGKNAGGILHLSITATMDPTLMERGNLMDGDWANYSRYDSQN